MSERLSGAGEEGRSKTARDIVRFAIRETMGTVMLALLLFLSAGRWDWGMGWVLVGITFAWTVGTGLILALRSPGLIADRLGPKQGAQRWDMTIMGIVGLTTIARCVVAGFDQRNGWTAGMSLPLQVGAAAVAMLAYGLVLWATAENAFFSQIVRIQEERGHQVVMGGPYRFVRHPGYVGSILFELAAPVILGSVWALPAGILAVILFFVRTRLEDRMLLKELEGYQAYAERVRYRLLPGVW